MKIERKKLILIIAAVVATILFTVIVFLSMTREDATVAPPTPTPTTPNTNNGGQVDANGDPIIPIIVEPGDDNPPPSDIYENDYSNDEGYLKLPEGFDGSVNPEGTVFDELWTIDTFNRLTCELSTKETVSEQALQPLKDFALDLRKVDYESAIAFRGTINRWMDDYDKNIGERPPASSQVEVSTVCELAVDVGEIR